MSLALARALDNAGNNMDARIAMMAITTRSSMRVKRDFFIWILSFLVGNSNMVGKMLKKTRCVWQWIVHLQDDLSMPKFGFHTYFT